MKIIIKEKFTHYLFNYLFIICRYTIYLFFNYTIYYYQSIRNYFRNIEINFSVVEDNLLLLLGGAFGDAGALNWPEFEETIGDDEDEEDGGWLELKLEGGIGREDGEDCGVVFVVKVDEEAEFPEVFDISLNSFS